LEEMDSVNSPFSMILAISLLYMAFIMLRYISTVPGFYRGFYHERMLNFVKVIFYNYWDDHVIFVFASVYMLYHIY
jgi:hypothetical protein